METGCVGQGGAIGSILVGGIRSTGGDTKTASPDAAGPRTAPPPGVGGSNQQFDANEKDIVGDMIPFVEKNYRARVGLSMGSSIAANVGLKQSGMFASIGVLSSGMFRVAPAAPMN